ncbi:hypothetical protein ANN_03958 [Periplaneta americana]|uniref:Uncharacterized protein n=1 Tax=Periplaneta americana TaxID=6978 RepID=A0ABQ8T938_PERAM|nr:hypothetical protein ANN_03958 [Periplaneta americana]
MLGTMIPRLNDLFENENGFYFEQDGTSAHFHVNARNFLDRTLNQRWIGRRGSAAGLPPRSPDLTPPDFYLWGPLKDTVIGLLAVFEKRKQLLLAGLLQRRVNDSSPSRLLCVRCEWELQAMFSPKQARVDTNLPEYRWKL